MIWETTDPTKLAALVALTRGATALRPDIARNWESLARLLLQTDQEEAAIAVLTEATSRLPNQPRLQLMLADAYRRIGRSDLLCEVLDRTANDPIDDRQASFGVKLWMRSDAADGPARLATEALALDPTNPEAIASLGGAARRQGRPEAMLDICAAALERDPAHTLARYELAIAHAMLGRAEDARRLIDLDRFIRVVEAPTPRGFGNAAAFEAALVGEIDLNPTLRPDRAGKATKGGSQSGALPQAGDRAISALLEGVRAAVDAFESSLPKDSAHPFVKRRPKQARLRAWAVVVRGGGRQVSHIHPDGWLSGVYYVSVPSPDRDDPRRGCLVLGSLEGKGLGVDPPWGTRDIQPAPGRLVLFPSYVPHATLPTQSGDARTCISFDVTPVASEEASDHP